MMKIDTTSSHQYASQRTKTQCPIGRADSSASFASILKTKTTQAIPAGSSMSTDANQPDFTNMTRQEMFDWMNEQIASGNMSFEESSPFLAMTVKVSVATGQPVDMSTDNTRINFIEKASMGIEGALSRNDRELVKSLQMALEIMHRNHGQEINILS